VDLLQENCAMVYYFCNSDIKHTIIILTIERSSKRKRKKGCTVER
jgi:hypothetical protein